MKLCGGKQGCLQGAWRRALAGAPPRSLTTRGPWAARWAGQRCAPGRHHRLHQNPERSSCCFSASLAVLNQAKPSRPLSCPLRASPRRSHYKRCSSAPRHYRARQEHRAAAWPETGRVLTTDAPVPTAAGARSRMAVQPGEEFYLENLERARALPEAGRSPNVRAWLAAHDALESVAPLLPMLQPGPPMTEPAGGERSSASSAAVLDAYPLPTTAGSDESSVYF